jgi:hypothetical protein
MVMRNDYVYLIKDGIEKSISTTRKEATHVFWQKVAARIASGISQSYYTTDSPLGDRVWFGTGSDDRLVVVSVEKYLSHEFPSLVGSDVAARYILSNLGKWSRGWVEWAMYWKERYLPEDEQPIGTQL